MRIVLADDNMQFRAVLRRLLERDPEISVVAEAASGAQAVALCEELRPDVVLMDVSMPELDGLEATHRLKTVLPDLVVLMLSVGNKEQEIAAGLANGAAEYLVKGTPATEILDAIKRHRPVPGAAA
ncbi:MAG: response regulator transcription factor [Actinomycetota bacterium]